ncbi:MAG: hypothetical protein K2X01_02605 [Cyanobacteria bacterium]|nr:hypothetical protein [Cyanobacteriota bacterium]
MPLTLPKPKPKKDQTPGKPSKGGGSKKPSDRQPSKKTSKTAPKNKPAKGSKLDLTQITAASLTSPDKMQDILTAIEKELAVLQPEVDRLEDALQQLQSLKATKQKLLTLRMSIRAIMENYHQDTHVSDENTSANASLYTPNYASNHVSSYTQRPVQQPVLPHYVLKGTPFELQQFNPETALSAAKDILRQQYSINTILYQAIVDCGGVATTEMIKHYLLENGIQQPANGMGFEDIPLSEISSRVNYLVRKGLVSSIRRGTFAAANGWA